MPILPEGSPSPSIVLVGKINAAAFHKAKALLESIRPMLASLTVSPLLPFEYDAELKKLKQQFSVHPCGAHVWAHTAPVAAYSATAGWIGDEVALLKYLPRCGISASPTAFNSCGRASSWEDVAEAAFSTHLTSTGLTYTYLDFEVGGQPVGRLVFELFTNRCYQLACGKRMINEQVISASFLSQRFSS